MAIGDFVGKFGSNGTGDGQFNQPFGIAVDGTYIYVSDQLNYRVQVFNKNSPWNFVAKFGSTGSGDGQFPGYPRGIAVDNNYIYVKDTGGRVTVFDKSYNYVKKTTLLSTTSSNPLAIDNTYIYTNDANAVLARILTLTMVSVDIFTTSTTVALIGVFVDSNYIYLSNAPTVDKISVYNKNSPYSEIIEFGSTGSGDGQFNTVGYLYVEEGKPTNYIYVPDIGNNRIEYFNKTDYSFVGKFGSLGSGNGQFNIPRGIVGDNNFLYVVEQNNNRVQIFNGNPSFVPGAQSGGGSGGGGASGRRLKSRYSGRSLGR